MKKFTLALALFAGIFTSCNNDDSSPVLLNNSTPEADGEWHLIQVTGGIVGINHLFEPGTITWTFNDDGTVSVENTNTNAALEDFFDTGTYDFSIAPNDEMPNECSEVVIVENVNFGCQDFIEDDMVLTQFVADGYTLKFTK